MTESSAGVLLVTHGGPGIGGGHVLRCRSLATALDQRGRRCRWVASPEARPLFSKEDDVVAWCDPFGPEGILMLRRMVAPGTLVVVDSYAPSAAWFHAMAERAPLVVVDDHRERPVEEWAVGILNHNLGAETLPYGRQEGVGFWLGPHYALLRPVFWDLRGEDHGYVLAVVGASDPLGATEVLMAWWNPFWPPLHAVIGPLVSADRRRACHRLAAESANVLAVDAPDDLPERMAKAGRVLCTASVTAYEALALRKPLTVFQVAENQRRIGLEIARRGLGTDLGFWGTWGEDALAEALRAPWEIPPAVVNPRGALAAAAALCAL